MTWIPLSLLKLGDNLKEVNTETAHLLKFFSGITTKTLKTLVKRK